MKYLLRSFLPALFAGAVAWLSFAGSARAQTIANPSFEATPAFTVFPGYISGNTAIPGWTANDNSRAGISLTGAASPFVNNGAIPNGTNAAFIQSGAAGGSTLSTVITGLTPGQLYKVNFRACARTNASVALSTPNLKVSVDGTTIVDAAVHAVSTAVNAVAWRFFAFDFMATGSTATMDLKNDTAGDTSALVDDFTIAPSTGSWSIAQWTNDFTSGVDSTKLYTHAYNFGSANSPVINGVTFTGNASGNPSAAGRFASSFPSVFGGPDVNVLTMNGGGSATMAQQFVFNANPETLTIHGLTPGAEYVATLFSVGWTETIRPVTFSVGTDRLTVNQDHYTTDVGIRVSYRYIASASGNIVITITPLIPNPLTTFHCYGFANYEVNPQPVVALQSRNAIGAIGNTNYFRANAAGTRPLSFQWLKDGSPLTDQTNAVLVVPVTSAADAGSYSVTVTNVVGTNTSAAVSLSLGQIANPSFEADIFYGFPGYVGVAAPNPPGFPISGWNVSNTNRAGINPTADGQVPFANNGTIPDGTQVAFIQSVNPGASVLSTLIAGLTPGTVYTVQFRGNARNGQRPNLHIGIDGSSIVDIYHSSVGGTNAYRQISFDFTAASSSALLTLTNDISGDHTLLVDQFTIAPSTSKWSIANWTSDATSGVDPTKLHTHAFYFGATTPDTNINGVVFRGAPGGNPNVPGFLTMSGYGNIFTGDVNALTAGGGGSAGIASQFIYGGPIQNITLSGLQPGTEYVASVFAVGFDPRAYGRSATFSVGSDRMTLNQDHFGNDQGIVISYRYIADPSGSITMTFTPTDAASTIHTYAVANRVAVDSEPVIGVQPMNTFAAEGTTATLVVGLSAGSLPVSFQWYSNGVALADQTNATLVLSNLTGFGTNGFSVTVTNVLGAATSVVATVEVGAALSDVFNTGVDDANAYLPGGIVDSHYRLVLSPDPFFPGPDAVTLHNGAFPLAGNYFTNGPFSSWISPRTNSSVGNSNGYYVYRTSFLIDSTETGRAQLNGRWASDNEGIAILLNGNPTGISNMVSAAFGAFVPFSITNGFIVGSNIVDIVISNGPATGPTAVRVEMTGVGRPLPPTAPQIVNQPTPQTVAENGEARFVVVGYGSGPLHYQWYFEGFPLPDQTNRVLHLVNVAVDQAGMYSVVITNDAGSTNSAAAALTVIVPPFIVADPVSQTVRRTSNAVFTVTVDGDAPFTYQWYYNSNSIPGATAATLTLLNVEAAQNGSYYVAVSNLIGGVISASATLTVITNDPPVANPDGGATSQGRAFGITLGKLVANDTDVDGDVLTVIAVSAASTNGGAVTLTSSNAIYTPLPGFTGVDRFSYTISDGHGNTAIGIVEVFVASGNLPSQNLVALAPVPGGFLIRFAGIPGRTYAVQRAPAVTGPWTTLTTTPAPLHGIIEYTDTNPPPGSAFYRTIAVP